MNISFHRVFVVHHFGESATNSIAHFSALLDFVVPPINVEVASSRCSRGFRQHVVCRRNGLPLQGQFPRHKRYFCLARNTEKRTLEIVQLRFLGLQNNKARTIACTAQALAHVQNMHALKRTTPEEIAPSVLYLASDASSFMTGNALLADGGMSIYRV